jgi:phosphinothricin acetyltransferase
MGGFMLRPVCSEDAAAITAIYSYYVEQTAISFEEVPPSADEMASRIADISAHCPYLVYEEGGVVLGYAYVHPYHTRAAYRHTLEDSIYVKQGAEGKGIGTALMKALVTETAMSDCHAIIACITQPNEKSVTLHEKHGFKPLGIFREVGRKFDQWRDVGYWELLLDYLLYRGKASITPQGKCVESCGM